MRVFHFVIKKRKRALRPDSFFSMILTFLKYFLFQSYPPKLFTILKMFFVVFYLVVHWGTGVFLWFFFFTPPLARDLTSRSLRACLRLTEKRWKIAPVLLIQASSIKLRIHGFPFLVFLHMKTNGQNKLFL